MDDRLTIKYKIIRYDLFSADIDICYKDKSGIVMFFNNNVLKPKSDRWYNRYLHVKHRNIYKEIYEC